MKPLLALTATLVTTTLLTTAGCTALYLFNASEENLPCGPEDANGTPRCLDGFVCVEADDGIERCLKAGFKEEGAACIDSGECKDGAVCADVYAERCDGDVVASEFKIDCALRDQGDRGLRCRRACKDDFTCGADLRCFEVEGLPPFCQKGTCASDNDCVGAGTQGLCIQEALNGGRSGLCREKCEPLDCFGGAGACPCDVGDNCATPPDEGVVSARAVCQPSGTITAGNTCDAANLCASGSTCASFGDFSACAEWCRVGGGGAPVCNNPGDGCVGVDNAEPALGICQ
jgi:hypothetical protein